LTITLQQPVGLPLAQILAELGAGICFSMDPESLPAGLTDLGGSPAVELRTALQQHFHQAYHPRVLDFDALSLPTFLAWP
jgi:hypothetical protein